MVHGKIQMKYKAQMPEFSKKETVLTLSHFGIHLAFGF
jgi:hypothetical protein